MSKLELEYLNECIDKDKANIDTIDDMNFLKELYQVYFQYYSFLNSEFDSFNAKLSNLSSLVTVSLGFFITIATFLAGTYLHIKHLSPLEWCAIILALIATIGLIVLLIIICKGQSFKKFLTLEPTFPLSIKPVSENETGTKTFYRKMIFCLYKVVRRNGHSVEKIKQRFPYAFTGYIACIIAYMVSLLLLFIDYFIK